MRYASSLFQELALSKAELVAAVNATDTWINDNQSSYNNALPTTAQSGLSTAQKTLMFCIVAAMRVSVAFARRLVGEVD